MFFTPPSTAHHRHTQVYNSPIPKIWKKSNRRQLYRSRQLRSRPTEHPPYQRQPYQIKPPDNITTDAKLAGSREHSVWQRAKTQERKLLHVHNTGALSSSGGMMTSWVKHRNIHQLMHRPYARTRSCFQQKPSKYGRYYLSVKRKQADQIGEVMPRFYKRQFVRETKTVLQMCAQQRNVHWSNLPMGFDIQWQSYIKQPPAVKTSIATEDKGTWTARVKERFRHYWEVNIARTPKITFDSRREPHRNRRENVGAMMISSRPQLRHKVDLFLGG